MSATASTALMIPPRTSRSRTTTPTLRSSGRCRCRRCLARDAAAGSWAELLTHLSMTRRIDSSRIPSARSASRCGSRVNLFWRSRRRQARRGVLLIEFGSTVGNRPRGFEAERVAERGEVHPVRPRIGARLTGDQQLRARHHIDYRLRDLCDGQIVRFGADIVCTAVHLADRSFEGQQERRGDVAGVHQRTPRGAVGQHPHVARSAPRDRPDCSARCRRAAAARSRMPLRYAGIPARMRRRDRGDVILDPDLALRVRRQRSQRRILGRPGRRLPTPYTEQVDA